MTRPPRLLLISDLHLSEARQDLVRAFMEFLDRESPKASALYILGDLFDVWIGDDDDRPLRRSITNALKQQSDQGLAIFLMHGNRDFLLGAAFAHAAGATLLAEPHRLHHQGRQYLLLHGDVLCTGDSDYLRFRHTVRNPDWQTTFLTKSLAERRTFAEEARNQSKLLNSNKAADIMDVSQQEVDHTLATHGLATMIHGHTHRPMLHQWQYQGQDCQRFVLGDWESHYWYVAIDGSGPELIRQSI